MSSIAPTSWRELDTSRLDKSILRRFKFNPISDGTTGLNPKGQKAFDAQIKEIAAKFGHTEPLSWGKNEEGKFILLQEHEEKAEIEEALNNDSKLKEILADPENSYDISKGGFSARTDTTAPISARRR